MNFRQREKAKKMDHIGGSVSDPVFFYPWIRDGEKNPYPGSGKNITDHFSESLKIVFLVKNI